VGSYSVNNNAYGKQVLSQKKTLPSPKIGTGTRDAFKRVRAQILMSVEPRVTGGTVCVWGQTLQGCPRLGILQCLSHCGSLVATVAVARHALSAASQSSHAWPFSDSLFFMPAKCHGACG